MTDGRAVHTDEERIRALLAFGRYAEAEQAARVLLASHPESAAAHRDLAQALLRQGRASEAVASAREAVALQPADPPLVLLSTCLRMAGDRLGALETARSAVAARPQTWGAHWALAAALLMLRSSESAAEALVALDEAARLSPHEPDVSYLRGLALSRLDRRDEARLAYEQTLAQDPQHSAALNNLGALEVRGRPLRASERFSAAAALDPQRPAYRQNIGVAIRSLLARVGYVLIGVGAVASFARLLPWTGARLVLLVVAALVYVAGLILAFRLLPRGLRRSPRDVRAMFGGRKTGWLWVSVLLAVDAGIALASQGWPFVAALYLQAIRTVIRKLNH